MRRLIRPEVTSPICRRTEAIRLVGGEGMFRRMEAAEWFQAKVRTPGYTAYLREDILAALARLLAGEVPPTLPSK
jgi:hypothetical protein